MADKRFPIRCGSDGRYYIFARLGLAEWFLCSVSRYQEALKVRRRLKVLLAANAPPAHGKCHQL